MFFLTIAWFMPVLIDRNDRMGSAGGLQIRAPYCDHRLVGMSGTTMGDEDSRRLPKGILRKALAGAAGGRAGSAQSISEDMRPALLCSVQGETPRDLV